MSTAEQLGSVVDRATTPVTAPPIKRTKVRFPRFEQTMNPRAPFSEQQLERVPTRRWVSPAMVRALAEAQDLPSSQPRLDREVDAKAEHGWSGSEHRIFSRVSPFFYTYAYFHSHNPARGQFWAQGNVHISRWGENWQRRKHAEIVLLGFEDFVNDEGQQSTTWRKYGALLIDCDDLEKQQFVVPCEGEEGWRSPRPEEEPAVASMLFTMTRIALNDLHCEGSLGPKAAIVDAEISNRHLF